MRSSAGDRGAYGDEEFAVDRAAQRALIAGGEIGDASLYTAKASRPLVCRP